MAQALEQQPAVRQSGQRIEERQVLDFLLGLLALGDVGLDRQHRLRPSGIIAHQRQVRLHRQAAAILAPFDDLAAPVASLQQHRTGGVEFLLFDNAELGLGLAERLLHAPAEQAFRPLVPVRHPGVDAGYRDRVPCLVEQRRLYPVMGFGPGALRFHPLLFGDVDHRADDPGSDAVAVAKEGAAVAHIRIRAVTAHEAVLVAPCLLLRAQDGEDPRHHARAIIRMDPAGPPFDPGIELFKIVAEYAVDAFAPPDVIAHRIPIADDVGRGAGDDPEAFRIVAAGFLCLLLTFGNVGAAHRRFLC